MKRAHGYGYYLKKTNERTRHMYFTCRDGSISIIVYFTDHGYTVATCLDHPSKGKTQLIRPALGMEELERVFENPRIHSGKGYIRRKDRIRARQPSGTKPVYSTKVRTGIRTNIHTGIHTRVHTENQTRKC